MCVHADLFMRQFERKRLPSGESLPFPGRTEILDAHTDEGFKVLVLVPCATISLLQPRREAHLLARRLVNDSIVTVEFVEVVVGVTSHSLFTMSRREKL